MFPPPSAHRAARHRTLAAITSLRHGQVQIGGDWYEAAVSPEGEGYDLTDQGQRVTQRIRVAIAKRILLDRPRRGQVLRYDGAAYEVELVSGDAVGDPHWGVVAFRTPGVE